MESATFTAIPADNTLQGQLSRSSVRFRKKHFLMIFIAGVVSLALLLFLFLHAYIAWVLMYPDVAPIASNPKSAIGLDYIDVRFPSNDQSVDLEGWYIPAADTTRTVIFSHGYGANREETWVPMYDLAAWLHEQNYNVLMFDYAFASATDRRPVTGGKEEAQQLIGAIHWAKNNGAGPIYVWGFSMGAGTALQAALLTDEIDAMILDSTFLLEPDTLFHNLKQHIDLPRNPSLALVRGFFPLLNGVSLNQIPYAEVKSTRYNMPILMIHGTEDAKAPYQIAQEIAMRQLTFASDWWLVQGGRHELLYRVHSEEYLQRVADFLKTLPVADELQHMIADQEGTLL